jgi:hypothetical protein
MIRIDELYNNIFLPKLQVKPLHGLHWFDPFGSVEFADLCSVPAVPWNEDSVRYLFWDQEPLHQDTIDRTLGQFKAMYNGDHHLITSEYASDAVEYASSTYNMQPHYYFFHGWAALDWFRGYNRTFLMQPYNERKIKHTFVMPNRIVAGARQHRLIMLYHIFKRKLDTNLISCPLVCPAENISVHKAVDPLAKTYPDISEVFANITFPKQFVGEANAPMRSSQLDLFAECSQSLLYLITETVATGRRCHLTEKTFKPIALKMPFVLVSTAHSLRYLRSYGFRTFEHLWDETYDTVEDDDLRYAAIARTLKDIDELPLRCRQRLLRAAEEVCEHNYNHFYSGGFESTLWAELTTMLAELSR